MTEQSRIEHHPGGGTSFVGRPAVEVYRAVVLASALRLYAKSGIKPNRAYTPKNMMATASAITGRTFKARDYLGASAALIEWKNAQSVPHVSTQEV